MRGSVHVEHDEILVSFDVSSLFTNVPVGEAVFIIHERFRGNKTLGDRTSPLRNGLQIYWRCAYSSPTSALGGTSMSRRLGNGLLCLCCGSQPLHGVLWGAGTGDGPDQTQAMVEVCWLFSAFSGKAQPRNFFTISMESGWPSSSLFTAIGGCRAVVAKHWWLKPEESLVWLPANAGLFTFLCSPQASNPLVTEEARCSQ